MELVVPSFAYLDAYADALRRGWSADNIRLEVATREELAKIAADPRAFVASLDDREARGDPITLPDGSKVARLPGFRRWMWDGEFCGAIGFRWQNGTHELPPTCLGHIGYSVVPWKRRRGYATLALGMVLRDAPNRGLKYVEITTDPENIGSQRVILANGGVLVERFTKTAHHGGTEGLRYRITV